jgi:hypothetical protein
MRKTVVRKTDNMRKTNIRKTANKIANANLNSNNENNNASGTAYLINDYNYNNNKLNENQKPEKLYYITGRGGENLIPNSHQRKIDKGENNNNNNHIMRKTSNKINKDDETKMKARITKNRITKFIRKTINNNNNNKDSDESDEDKELFGLNNIRKKNQ